MDYSFWERVGHVYVRWPKRIGKLDSPSLTRHRCKEVVLMYDMFLMQEIENVLKKLVDEYKKGNIKTEDDLRGHFLCGLLPFAQRRNMKVHLNYYYKKKRPDLVIMDRDGTMLAVIEMKICGTEQNPYDDWIEEKIEEDIGKLKEFRSDFRSGIFVHFLYDSQYPHNSEDWKTEYLTEYEYRIKEDTLVKYWYPSNQQVKSENL